MASLIGGVEDLVVEDGEVKGETQADRVGRRKLGSGNLSSSLVSLEGLVGGVLAAVANGELSEITVVVTLPARLVNKEDLGLARFGRGDKVLVKDLEDVIADLGELGLNLLSVLLNEGDLGRVAL
ncbi:hypothetical protein HG530_003492 [Fusarium avenaceum]|nr:hypothetical protein HG530_003492 [Fusarium avenaceum]